jgi:hypothetical protein
MSLRTLIIKQASSFSAGRINQWKKSAVKDQHATLKELIQKAEKTIFGQDHHFGKIRSYTNFKERVPVRDYEALRPYIDRVTQGEKDILWPGKPAYFAKTSGTTSGVKYIPISRESMPNHIHTARNAMFNYFHQKGHANVFEGKVIFLSGSPVLETKGGIKTGRLSGIVNHEVPSWIRSNQLPSYATNCIEDWEEKVNKIVEETWNQDMRLISGIPPWVQMYFERLLDKTGKATIKEVFPNYSLFMYGGVNYEPYRAKLESLIGSKTDSIETYPASEGFIAFQDELDHSGLLLNTNSGIFFEFIPAEKAMDEQPERVMLDQVELNKDYAIIINNNAGLWGYSIGDCVRFTSVNPYRLVVSGRVKHFISAFGEHVIGKEVEEAMRIVANQWQASTIEFTVAPQVNPADQSLPYHEWLVEFGQVPTDLSEFAKQLDAEMRRQNIYYDDLISGHILQPLKITMMQKDAFRNYMKSQGKLGGQNKVPRLSNDRTLADAMAAFVL